MEKIDLVQGSEEWNEYRKYHLNGSEAGAVMSCNPWQPKNPKELYELKTGKLVIEENEYMRRGTRLESPGLALFCQIMEEYFVPAVYRSGRYSASLDGINEALTDLVEIKCPRPENIQKWIDWHPMASLLEVAPHYFWQVIHQMYVCNSVNQGHFIVYDGDCIVFYRCFRREDIEMYFNPLTNRWEQFDEYFRNFKVPPKSLEPVDSGFQTLAEEYKYALKEEASVKNRLAAIKKKLIERYGETHACGIKVQQTTRSGQIDYKHPDIAYALRHFDLDAYRKEASTVWSIKED